MGTSHAAARRHDERGGAADRPALRSVENGSPGKRSRKGSKARSRSRKLSHKELLVLTELARGNSTEGIGETLYVSPHTVRTHIKNILRKLDANTRAHAVAIALTDGVIDP